MRKKIGEIMMEAGMLDEFQLQAALGHQRQWGGRIGQIAVDKGFVTAERLADSLAEQLDLPRFEADSTQIDTGAAGCITRELAEQYSLLAYEFDPTGALMTAMSDPTDLPAIDEVQFLSGKKVKIAVASAAEVQNGIRIAYGVEADPEPASIEIAGGSDASDDDMDLVEVPMEELEEVVAEPVDPVPAPVKEAELEEAAVEEDWGAAIDAPAKPVAHTPAAAAAAQSAAAAPVPAAGAMPVQAPKGATPVPSAGGAVPMRVASAAPPVPSDPSAVPEKRTAAEDTAVVSEKTTAVEDTVVVSEELQNGASPTEGLTDEKQEQILAALDAIASGDDAPAQMQRFVNPAQMVSALMRLLIRRGLIDEIEFIEELQKK